MKTDQLKVSVLIMTYNHEKYISETIQGVLLQKTNFDYDVVIGEDCSTDNTREIILKYKQLYPNVIKMLLHKKNIGAMANQLAVLSECTGKYIAICEGDDYWSDSQKLQKQVDFLDNNPECSLVCHSIMDDIGSRLNTRQIVDVNRYLTNEEIIIARGMITPTLSIVFRRKHLENLPKWVVTSPVGDIPLVFYLMTKGKVFCFKDIMGVYRKYHATSWSNKKRNILQRTDFSIRYNFFLQTFNKYTQYNYDKMIHIHSKLSPAKYYFFKIVSNIILMFAKNV